MQPSTSPSDAAVAGHENALLAAFAKVLKAEQRERVAKSELDAAKARLEPEIAMAQAAVAEAWAGVEALLAGTGEVEVRLPDEHNDFVIAWSAPREAVKVADASAVPDEWCKLERKPKLTEIAKLLKGMREQGLPMPNWASLERGEAKLSYRTVKKGAA